jgi:hypothetical protein
MTNTIGEHVDIFQSSPNGQYVLNLPALNTLIEWAEGDERLAARFGTWDQGQWAQAMLHPGVEYSGDTIDTVKVTEETRNGVCETAYCMAGQTVVQAGYRLIYQHYGYGGDGQPEFNTSDCIKQEYIGRDATGKPQFRDTGEVMAISVAAARILGLDYDESNCLFDGDNEIEDLKHLINSMCERRNLPEPYPDTFSDRAQGMVDCWPDRVG